MVLEASIEILIYFARFQQISQMKEGLETSQRQQCRIAIHAKNKKDPKNRMDFVWETKKRIVKTIKYCLKWISNTVSIRTKQMICLFYGLDSIFLLFLLSRFSLVSLILH